MVARERSDGPRSDGLLLPNFIRDLRDKGGYFTTRGRHPTSMQSRAACALSTCFLSGRNVEIII